jgi:hypothetical protein
MTVRQKIVEFLQYLGDNQAIMALGIIAVLAGVIIVAIVFSGSSMKRKKPPKSRGR